MRRIAVNLLLLSIFLLLGLLSWPGCGDDSNPTGGGDAIPPAGVTDLAPIAVTDSSLILVWTAPGDDDTIGTAAGYEIRYSTLPDSLPDWWDSLCTTPGTIPLPKPAGERESLLVENLEADTTYYFALRSSDEVPNWSGLSNIVRVLPAGSPPEQDTNPPADIRDLHVASMTDSSVTIQWTAPGDDSTFGTAAAYDIRYSARAMTRNLFLFLGQESGPPPVPSPAGSLQAHVVGHLLQETVYWIALRTADEAANWSRVSNVIQVTTEETEPDTVPPAAVSDLWVFRVNEEAVILRWTSPGDDGDIGKAEEYDVRYSTVPLDSATWPQATPWYPAPAPVRAGFGQQASISGLPVGPLYYFAVKTRDEVPLWSGLSNVSTATPPFVRAEQETLDFATALTSLPLVVRNPGEGTVRWTIHDFPDWITTYPSEGIASSAEPSTLAVAVERNLLEPGVNEGSLYVSSQWSADTVAVRAERSAGVFAFGRVFELIDRADTCSTDFARDSAGVAGVVVSLDGAEVHTDDQGYFLYEDMEPGTYPLHASKPFYLELDSLVTVGPDDPLQIPLRPELVDYFPLQVGNRWRYNRFTTWRAPSHFERVECWTEMEITSRSVEEEDTVFALTLHTEGIRLVRVYVNMYDTTDVLEDGTGTIRYRDNRVRAAGLPIRTNSSLARRFSPAYSSELVPALPPCEDKLLILQRAVGVREWILDDWPEFVDSVVLDARLPVR